MNNSSATQEELVQEINDELARLFIPAIVFTYINMVIGLVGNSMVCYYYGFKTKMTPTSVFILELAVYDLIVCTVTMPHEIVLSYHYYTYSNRYACKCVNFIGFFVLGGSVFALPAIAIDRYKHICASSVYKTTVKDALKQSAIVVTLALVFAWPVIILYDIEVAPLPIEYGPDLEGTTCSIRSALNIYKFVLDVVRLIMIFLCMAIIVVLYFRISKVLYVHRQHFGKSKTTQTFNNHHTRIDRATAKTTIAMIVIAAVLFLSFIPRLSLSVWISIEGKRASHFLSGADLVGFQIGFQSYMLNSSLNPWIYGIFNSRFRKFYYMKLCTVCKCPRDTTTTSSRETTESSRV